MLEGVLHTVGGKGVSAGGHAAHSNGWGVLLLFSVVLILPLDMYSCLGQVQ